MARDDDQEIDAMEAAIRPETMATIRRYVFDRIPPGSYMLAVLRNDLFGAFHRADYHSRAEMGAVVRWLYNRAPAVCMGSPARVEAWLDGAYGAEDPALDEAKAASRKVPR